MYFQNGQILPNASFPVTGSFLNISFIKLTLVFFPLFTTFAMLSHLLFLPILRHTCSVDSKMYAEVYHALPLEIWSLSCPELLI